ISPLIAVVWPCARNDLPIPGTRASSPLRALANALQFPLRSIGGDVAQQNAGRISPKLLTFVGGLDNAAIFVLDLVDGYRLLHLDPAKSVIFANQQNRDLAVPDRFHSSLEPRTIECIALFRAIVPDMLIQDHIPLLVALATTIAFLVSK